MVINWKIHRRRRLIFAFVGFLFGYWFVQTAIVKYDVGLLVHDNPPGTPVSKTKAYVRSHGWFQDSRQIRTPLILTSRAPASNSASA